MRHPRSRPPDQMFEHLNDQSSRCMCNQAFKAGQAKDRSLEHQANRQHRPADSYQEQPIPDSVPDMADEFKPGMID